MFVLVIFACRNIESRHVSKDEFLILYSTKWACGDYWEYKGKKDDKHWLIHYRLPDVQTLPVAVESAWIPIEDLPEDFPTAAQQPLNYGDLKKILKDVR